MKMVRLLLVVIVQLLIIVHVQFLLFSSSVTKECSRERCRLARFVLDEHFFPVFKKWQGRVSRRCPFRRSADIYFEQEKKKTEVDARNWKCEFCGKSFYSEHFIDQHMERKHKDVMVTENPVCLSNYCDVLRCHAVQYTTQNRPLLQDRCNENDMLRLKARCETWSVWWYAVVFITIAFVLLVLAIFIDPFSDKTSDRRTQHNHKAYVNDNGWQHRHNSNTRQRKHLKLDQ